MTKPEYDAWGTRELIEELEKRDSMQTLVYMIKVDDQGSDDYDNEDFIRLAEEQGTVFSLWGYSEYYNRNDFNAQDYYIKFINTK